jgi:histidinol-phosphate aminotransferase
VTKPVRLRSALDAVPAYRAGRTAPPGAYKISSNENPYPPLPSVRKVLEDAAGSVNRYPDFTSAALVGALAQRFDEPPDCQAVGTGSVGVLQQALQSVVDPGDEVVFAWRSFEAYPIITQVVGAGRRMVPLRGDHTHDLPAMLAAISPQTRLVFVCNPNNPTGTAVPREELIAFLDAVPDNVLIVLDEAYHEFVTDPAVADGVALRRDRDNLAVLRTFSKAYRLAGLRVGYCVAPEPVVAALRKVSVPFSVNSVAQAAAVASLDVADELLAHCRQVTAERDRIRAELLAMGYAVPDSQTNFIWLPLGQRSDAFNDHCRAHKVVIRPFSGDGVRVTIGNPQENDLFLSAAHDWPR